MTNKYWNLDQEHVLDGVWWLVDDESSVVAGRLLYVPSSQLELLLFSQFAAHNDDMEVFFSEQGRQKFEVYGQTAAGVQVTLSNCVVISTKGSRERLYVESALIGVQLDVAKKEAVTSLTLSVSNLESWVNGFEFKVNPPQPQGNNEFEVSAGPARFTDMVHARLTSLPGTVKIPSHISFHREPSSLQLTYRCDLRIIAEGLISLDDAHRISHFTTILLGLLIGKPTIAKRLHFSFQGGGGASFLANSWERLKPPEWPRSLCPLTEKGFDFAAVLDRWLEMSTKLYTPIKLLHSVLMKTGTFLETEVTEMMQAIEGYCAATNPFFYLTDDEFAAALNKMLTQIVSHDEPFRHRVKGTIKHLNRPSSRSYLKSLIDNMDSALVRHVTRDENPRKFIARAVDVRNTIVHPQSGSIWNDFTPTQIVTLISQLKHLLIVSLLSDAGVPVEVLRRRYGEFEEWQWA